MPMPCLSPRDVERLAGVHADLVRVVARAAELSSVHFVVTEGLRTKARQKQLVAAGKSQTMKSRHLTGHAVDLACWFDRDEDKVVDADELSWKFSHYQLLAGAMKQAAAELKIPLEWGGDWKTLKDGPHFQLPWKSYP